MLGMGSAAGREDGLNSTPTLPSSAPVTSCATSCAASCAASFTCPSFTCRPGALWGAACVCWAWVLPLEDGACHDEHLNVPVLHGAQHVLCNVLRYVLRHVLRCVLHVLVLGVSPKGRCGGRYVCVVRGFRRWKMVIDIISTFTPTSFAASSTSSAKSFAKSFMCDVPNYFYFGGKTSCRFSSSGEHTHTGIVGYRKRPLLYAQRMPLPVLRESHPPGRRPRTPL